MPFDVSAVPNDIWFEIASFLDLKEVLSLEATCKFLREVVSDKVVWLKRLRALDQDHAPNLPRQVSVSDLSWEELRILVVRAHRRRLNCTGPAPTRPTRETTIRIGSVNSDVAPGGSYGDVKDMKLLPGGALLLVLRSEGDLQCWTVPGGECLWSYRPHASSDTQRLKVCSFTYDMQVDGDVRVLAVSEFADRGAHERTLEIFQFSPREKTPVSLYKRRLECLNKMNGQVKVARLSGDVWAACTMYDLIVTFWKEDRSVVIRDRFFQDVHLVNGYLIGVFGLYENKSVIAFQISSMRNIQPSASAQRATQILTLEHDIPYTSCPIPHTPVSQWSAAKLSICTFHWKSGAERKRKGIYITMSVDIRSTETPRCFPALDSFLLKTTADTGGVLEDGENDQLPSITHLERPGTIILDPQLRGYSRVSRPSQAGSAVMHFYDSAPVNDPPWVVWMLATISCEGGMEYRTLDMPRSARVKMESYSGALYFVADDAKSIVIQYLD
ncbi:hypothetical protein DFH11DRAFT_1830749 [Phellopilus nigrolimitatus]|nr:hypothetical protein DFH11DRAFT_1830749 [Phellopilus nigrolimitatus]